VVTARTGALPVAIRLAADQWLSPRVTPPFWYRTSDDTIPRLVGKEVLKKAIFAPWAKI